MLLSQRYHVNIKKQGRPAAIGHEIHATRMALKCETLTENQLALYKNLFQRAILLA